MTWLIGVGLYLLTGALLAKAIEVRGGQELHGWDRLAAYWMWACWHPVLLVVLSIEALRTAKFRREAERP